MNFPTHADGSDPREHDPQVTRPYCNLCDRPAFDPTMLARLRDQSRLRLILMGFPEDVNREILNLHHCGYDLDAWSPPQRIPGSAEVVTVYIKRSRRL